MSGMQNNAQTLCTSIGNFTLVETISYPNGGHSYFYCLEDAAIILDEGICDPGLSKRIFAYSRLTNKQNEYMSKYRKVYRFLMEDISLIDETLSSADSETSYSANTVDRADLAEASVLEMKFEEVFLDVYGSDSSKYLWKEYGITDNSGKTKYLDYFIHTDTGDIAVEENGISYHHPQIIGLQKYREQLSKQNVCTNRNIKLYRFSTEDVQFKERMGDDLRTYFGADPHAFHERGLTVDRPVVLYEHQKTTLQDLSESRKEGIKSFLIVFPTASGKSKIVEEDIKVFDAENNDARYLILVPNITICEDWQKRIDSSLSDLKNRITLTTYAYMERHFTEFAQNHFQYIVVDEAHHAAAPGLKRTIQYFTPEFLIGLTATDERPDKRKLEAVFGSYHVGLSLQEAMDKGIIAKARAYRIETNINLSSVRINGKDYVNADLEKSVRITSRNELIADVLRQYFCEGETEKRQGIVFCVNVAHTLEMEKLLNAAGIPARSYTGRSKDPMQIMEDFRNHKIRFLCTCQMISEGWDYPELGILVMARPTLSKVLYLQQLGRGLRKTDTKKDVFVIDVVDEYGTMVRPCSLHAVFNNPYYVPFGDILRKDYSVGDFITVDGMRERIERIVEVDTASFEEKYGNYLSVEQLAREYYVNTGTINSWIRKKKITPTVSFPFGSKQIHLFSPEDTERIRLEQNISRHDETTIKQDFFDFLEERDYSLSYKMPFLIYFLQCMDASGDAKIDDVLDRYISFYRDRIDKGLPVDRKSCPYTVEYLADRTMIKRNMLTNPFEKFERKRFLYYSKDLNVISMNHALHAKLTQDDYRNITAQMQEDLENYYKKLED